MVPLAWCLQAAGTTRAKQRSGREGQEWDECVYSRSPKNPALQQLQKSSKSASTTPQRPIWNSFCNSWSAGFLGERLYSGRGVRDRPRGPRLTLLPGQERARLPVGRICGAPRNEGKCGTRLEPRRGWCGRPRRRRECEHRGKRADRGTIEGCGYRLDPLYLASAGNSLGAEETRHS